MSQESSVVCLYPSIDAAEEAVRKLGQSGFPIQQVSIISKDLGSEKKVHGFVTSCDVARSRWRAARGLGRRHLRPAGRGRVHLGAGRRSADRGRVALTTALIRGDSKGQLPGAALSGMLGWLTSAGNLQAAHPEVRGERQGWQVHGGAAHGTVDEVAKAHAILAATSPAAAQPPRSGRDLTRTRWIACHNIPCRGCEGGVQCNAS